MSADADPDAALLARIGAGEPGAVRAMIARKLPRLLALATRLLGDAGEAEDVAQESFLRIWRQAAQWQSGTARFDTWLHRVVLNLCYDRLRRRRERPTEIFADRPDPDPLPDAQMEERDRAARVAQALQLLPDRQREALVLQYYQELSNADVADLMGIKVTAVESLLARARRSLRQHMGDEDDG